MHLPHESNLGNSSAESAEVAELVDALGSGSSRRTAVGVRVSPSAPSKNRGFTEIFRKPFLFVDINWI